MCEQLEKDLCYFFSQNALLVIHAIFECRAKTEKKYQ